MLIWKFDILGLSHDESSLSFSCGLIHVGYRCGADVFRVPRTDQSNLVLRAAPAGGLEEIGKGSPLLDEHLTEADTMRDIWEQNQALIAKELSQSESNAKNGARCDLARLN